MKAYTHVGVSNLDSSVTTNTVIITWDHADSPSDCGPVFYYTVTVVNLSNGERSITESIQTRAEFSNLINGTNYSISIAAVNRAGTGPSSIINITGHVEGK